MVNTRLVPIHRSARPPLAPTHLGPIFAHPFCFLQPQATSVHSDFSTHLYVACPPPVQGNPSLSHPQGQPGSQEHCHCSHVARSQDPWAQTVVGRNRPAWDLPVPLAWLAPVTAEPRAARDQWFQGSARWGKAIETLSSLSLSFFF